MYFYGPFFCLAAAAALGKWIDVESFPLGQQPKPTDKKNLFSPSFNPGTFYAPNHREEEEDFD